MPTEEEIIISKIDESIKILIIDEKPINFRLWGALTNVLCRQDDLSMRVYAALLERNGEKISTRDLATLVDASLYGVRRALKALCELDVISQEGHRRGYLSFNYWSIKKQIMGILRLIPEEYFQEGYPTKLKK